MKLSKYVLVALLFISSSAMAAEMSKKDIDGHLDCMNQQAKAQAGSNGDAKKAEDAGAKDSR